MRASLAFDGVLTDHTTLDLARVDHRSFFASARSVGFSGPRDGVRQVAALLDVFTDLSILTARPAGHHEAIRQWLDRHLPELADRVIISSGEVPKAEMIRRMGISLHLDSDPTAAGEDTSEGSPVLVWRGETPSGVFRLLIRSLNTLLNRGVRTKVADAVQVDQVDVTSITPVFRVRSRSRDDLKVRIFPEPERSDLVRRFHRESPAVVGRVRVPAIVAASALSLVTPWITGQVLRHSTPDERAALIPDLARYLAALHGVGPADPGADRLVSCAVDAFNLCRSDDGDLHLIDVGDCTIGSRWLDLVWTGQLFCMSDAQRETLVDCYIAESGTHPTTTEVERAAAEYYGYLHHILMKAKRFHLASSSAWRACDEITERRRVPVTDSGLLSRATGVPR